MSYSFGVIGDSKEHALEQVSHQFDRVVERQADHQADRPAAEEAVRGLVACLHDDEATAKKGVSVQVNGSVSGAWSAGKIERVEGCTLQITVQYVNK